VIVLSHPEWWLDHVDELVDALTVATQAPERDEPLRAHVVRREMQRGLARDVGDLPGDPAPAIGAVLELDAEILEPAGHASLSSTQIYTRAAGHHVREAAHALPVRGQLRQLSPVRNNTEKNER